MSDQFTPEEVSKLRKLISSPVRTTHVLQVLDESGSMRNGQDITISSYNEMQQTAQNAANNGNNVTITRIKFNDTVSISSIRVPVENAVPLSNDNYRPSGSTSLYDAIGFAIETARNFPKDSETAFLLQIFTDGYENTSKQYTAAKLKDLISELNTTGKWTVTVAGPRGNIDLFTEQLGIYKGNTTTFDPSSLRSRVVNASNMVGSTQAYFSARAGGQSMVMNSYEGFQQDEEGTQTGISNVVSSIVPEKTEAKAAAWPFPTGRSENTTENKTS